MMTICVMPHPAADWRRKGDGSAKRQRLKLLPMQSAEQFS